mmetsp:Transcript_50928/g.115756  ORF Transcript_50928/g.115756 Transcript_50928/m.115756 type:complete len:213 (-) Transcript_50928:1599-2237(-)
MHWTRRRLKVVFQGRLGGRSKIGLPEQKGVLHEALLGHNHLWHGGTGLADQLLAGVVRKYLELITVANLQRALLSLLSLQPLAVRVVLTKEHSIELVEYRVLTDQRRRGGGRQLAAPAGEKESNLLGLAGHAGDAGGGERPHPDAVASGVLPWGDIHGGTRNIIGIHWDRVCGGVHPGQHDTVCRVVNERRTSGKKAHILQGRSGSIRDRIC